MNLKRKLQWAFLAAIGVIGLGGVAWSQGQTIITTLAGTELINVQKGPQFTAITAANLAAYVTAGGGGASLAGTNTWTGVNTFANQIVSNQSGWHYDNCQVARAALNPAGLRTIIEPFARRLSEKQILSCWAEAVRLAHGAKVDRLARNATAYAVECFKSQLKEKGKL